MHIDDYRIPGTEHRELKETLTGFHLKSKHVHAGDDGNYSHDDNVTF